MDLWKFFKVLSLLDLLIFSLYRKKRGFTKTTDHRPTTHRLNVYRPLSIYPPSHGPFTQQFTDWIINLRQNIILLKIS